MLKKIIGKLERKMIMTWMLMWLNQSGATINVMFQLLDIYIYIYIYIDYLQPFKHPISQLVDLFDYEWSNKNGGSI